MDKLQTLKRPEAVQALNPSLFDSFVDWLDRGERTTKAYVTNLRQFAAWMAYAGVTAPQRADLQAYREWLQEPHEAIQLDSTTAAGWSFRRDRAGRTLQISCKPSTVSAYLQTVKQFFSWTDATGIYPNVAENLRTPKVNTATHKKDCFQPSEVLAIERSIAVHAEAKTTAAESANKDRAGREQRSTEQALRLLAMFQLAVTAGLRTIEISRANLRDIEVKNGQAWIYVWGKGHSEPDQKKPIANPVYEALEDYIRSRTDNPTGASPLFVSTGNRSKGKRIASTTISTMLKRAMQQAGFDSPRLTAHSLRHTAGTAVQQLTGDLFQTQHFMRHSDPKVTEIYLHNDTEQQEAEIASRLYALYHGQADPATAQIDPAMLEYLQQLLKAKKAV